MRKKYHLMHKNNEVAQFELQEHSILNVRLLDETRLPILPYGNLQSELKKWLYDRVISLDHVSSIRNQTGQLIDRERLAFANKGRSLTDCYWYKLDPDDHWENISLWKERQDFLPLYEAVKTGKIFKSASIDGQAIKWIDNQHILHKEYRKRQDIAWYEYIASKISAHFVDTVSYEVSGSTTLSNLFTSESVEYIPMYYILQSKKKPNHVSDFDWYLQRCEAYGLNAREVGQFVRGMLVSDYLVNNVDRHYGNFGVLRDADSLKIIGIAPNFDFDRTMYHSYSYQDILDRKYKTHSFYQSDDKMIKKIVKTYDALPPIDELLDEVHSVIINMQIGGMEQEMDMTENIRKLIRLKYHRLLSLL